MHQAASVAGRILITPETERHLRANLERLRHELDVVFAARIGDARSIGDVSSDDHLQIREEEMVVRAEARRIEALLASAVVVEERGSSDGSAGIGSVVEVRDLDTQTSHRHLITGDFERSEVTTEGAHPVSASSPVGQALLGLAAGSEVLIELPNGRKRRLEVVSVASPPPEAASATATAQPVPA
jgi:transcription elongation factor GreA